MNAYPLQYVDELMDNPFSTPTSLETKCVNTSGNLLRITIQGVAGMVECTFMSRKVDLSSLQISPTYATLQEYK
jgi:hypothetical protein